MNLIKKILLWTIGVTISGAVLISLFALYGNFSGGEQVGKVIKIATKDTYSKRGKDN